MTARHQTLTERRGQLVLRLLLVLGAVLTIAGSVSALQISTASPNSAGALQVAAALLTSTGGALIGASASIIIARFSDQSALEEVREVIAANTASRLISEEVDLSPLRRTWYHYHLTIMNGTAVWRHRIYHFESSGGIGTLSTEIRVLDPAGAPHRYSIEAGVRGTRLILIQRRLEGHEDVLVSVYPDMLAGYQAIHCGTSFLQDWDGNRLLTKAILSRDPLVPELEEGTVPAAASEILTGVWIEHFNRGTKRMID